MIKKIILITFPFIIFLIFLELFSGLHYRIEQSEFYSPTSLKTIYYGSGWVQNQEKKYCEFGSRFWGPSAYLGYSRTTVGNEECFLNNMVNNQNMSGVDYPEVKDPDEFVLMVTGGSVAEGFSNYWDDSSQSLYFTQYLNDHFFPPSGKRFKVITGALGDYRHPQSLIVASLHHDIIDGIIDLSGYNESLLYLRGVKLESPSFLYWQNFDLVAEKLRNETIRDRLSWFDHSICKYSHFCFFLVQKLTDYELKKKYDNITTMRKFQQNENYPSHLNPSQQFEHRLKKHKGYYTLLNGICKTMSFKCAFYIQPIPQISKHLTEVEKRYSKKNPPHFGDLYAKMVNGLLELKKERVEIESLLNIFEHERGQIYSDEIHSNFSRSSKGNRIYSEVIARDLSIKWKLRKKQLVAKKR